MAPPKKITGPQTISSLRVPSGVWAKARLKGVLLGISMNDIIARLLRAWANDEIETPPAEEPPNASETE